MNATFHLPDDFWAAAEGTADGRLLGHLGINGTPFRVEAVPVTRQHGYQIGADPVSERRLEGLIAEFDAPGFETVRIRGKDYVVIIRPASLG